MKRFTALLLLCVGMAMPVSGICATPQELLKKLSTGAKDIKDNGMPVVVLTEAEENQLIDFFIIKSKERGMVLTRQQAAIMLGQVSGYLAIASNMAEAFSGAGKANPAKQQTRPEAAKIELTPSGHMIFEPHGLQNEFKNNEFATAKKLEGNAVCITGEVSGVKNAAYFENPKNFKSNKGEFPMISVGEFKAYLFDDAVDLAIINPGDRILLLCQNIANDTFVVQGECSVIALGRKDSNGKQKGVYKNDALMNMLNAKQQ